MEMERVQAIAMSSHEAIPAEFIRSEKDQPGKTTFQGPTPEIPVIDLSDPDRSRLVQKISEAAAEWGLFQVVNHGIPAEATAELQRVGKEFFELPIEEKEKVSMVPGSGSFEGYGTKLQKEEEGKKAWVDFLFHNIAPPSRVNYKFWPKTPVNYRRANEDYARQLPNVMENLSTCLSEGIGVEKDDLMKAAGGDDIELLMKINYYPPCPRPDLALGVVAHTDMSLMTLLVPNEVPGLRVFKDDRWYNAEYIPNALIIHIGDQLEIMSNGRYKAVLHRTTVSKDKTRMSWPVFCNPPEDMVVCPPALINDENPAKFKTKKFKDYAYCKINKIPQ